MCCQLKKEGGCKSVLKIDTYSPTEIHYEMINEHNHLPPAEEDLKPSQMTKQRGRELIRQNVKIGVLHKQMIEEINTPITGQNSLSKKQLRNMRNYEESKLLPTHDVCYNIRSLHKSTGFLQELCLDPLRVIFVAEEAIKLLQDATLMLIDTTFNVTEQGIVLTTVMVNTYDGLFVPAAWLLHDSAEKEVYVKFLKILVELTKNKMHLQAVLSDFDGSVSGACSEVLHCPWFGDYFHFKQANMRWMQSNKLGHLTKELDTQLSILYHSENATKFIENHINFITFWKPHSAHYVKYFEDQWGKRYSPDVWAHYGRSAIVPSGDNIQEAWHNRAKSELYKQQKADKFSIWLFKEWNYWWKTLQSQFLRKSKLDELESHRRAWSKKHSLKDWINLSEEEKSKVTIEEIQTNDNENHQHNTQSSSPSIETAMISIVDPTTSSVVISTPVSSLLGGKKKRQKRPCQGKCGGQGIENSKCNLKLCQECCLQDSRICTLTTHALIKIKTTHGAIVDKIDAAFRNNTSIWFTYDGGDFPGTGRQLENVTWYQYPLSFQGICPQRRHEQRKYHITKVLRMENFAFQS
mmetsp:Transcript_18272/g.25593  ORF Transcript_18272/g.25593 Transcript_18272/m.25593 type:complete len:578 (-) Transcript_18272:35-1768(-)